MLKVKSPTLNGPASNKVRVYISCRAMVGGGGLCHMTINQQSQRSRCSVTRNLMAWIN